MPHRFVCLLLPGLILAAQLGAEGVPGPARQVLDAYLAQAARTVTAYRAEIRVGDDPKAASPGRLSGESAYLGRFTYRPVTYAELSRAERARVVRDPQFRIFLERQRLRPGSSPLPADSQVSLSPEEMLRSAPFIVVLQK